MTYVGGTEEVNSSGSGTITTTSYAAGGHTIAEGVNGALSFLASDGLGSALVALDGSSGTATASVLYDPYGRTRYSNGAMPGSRGFTNQRADSTTGLDDYGARYYDAVAGAFVSADSVSDGLNRYAYVHGNPETLTDPTGHRVTCGIDCGGSSGGGTTGTGGPTPTSGGCTSDSNCDPNYGTPPSNAGGCKGNQSCALPGAVIPHDGQGTGGPNDAQIAAARQIARDTAAALGDAVIALGGIILGLTFVRGLLTLDPENVSTTLKSITAVGSAVAVLGVEATLLYFLFKAEAAFPDSFWSDPHNLIAFRDLTLTAIAGFNLDVAIASLAAAALSEDPLVIAAGAGGVAGAIMSFFGYTAVVSQAVYHEMDDLGYQAYESCAVNLGC